MRYTTVLALLLAHTGALAQPAPFGSADDPSETSVGNRWRRSVDAEMRTGFSLIGPDWRAASGMSLAYAADHVALRFEGAVRTGVSGLYEPDVDGVYDLLRLTDFARLSLNRNRLFARAGPTRRLRLGTGHLVNFFGSETAWDDRTVGLEGFWTSRPVQVTAFADDVRLNRLVGGRVVLRPLFWVARESTRSLEIGASYVTDRRDLDGKNLITAYNLDLRFTVANIGDVLVQPFATFSAYRNAGRGVGVGGELASDNFVDVARFRLRMAVYVSGDGFIPGYVGSFYRVNNPIAGILQSEDFGGADSTGSIVGIPLADAPSATALETEIRILFFDRFELWYSFRRQFGGAHLSESHLRLFFETGRIAAQISQDRGGLGSFFSVFNDLGDETSLMFRTDYHVARGIWVFVRAIYSYERTSDAPDGAERYVVQRRFEPYAGVKFSF